jgi:hypothetical protein
MRSFKAALPLEKGIYSHKSQSPGVHITKMGLSPNISHQRMALLNWTDSSPVMSPSTKTLRKATVKDLWTLALKAPAKARASAANDML